MRDYSRIINIPHHEIKGHKRMSNYERAAQFSPFAALSGYEDAIEETGRLTYSKIELQEDEQSKVNADLRDAISNSRPTTIRFFEEDKKKTGGMYKETSGKIIKYDDEFITLDNRTKIKLQDIVAVIITREAME